MTLHIDPKELTALGASPDDADRIVAAVDAIDDDVSDEEAWREITTQSLSPAVPFDVHRLLFERVYAERGADSPPAPAWLPDADRVENANLTAFAKNVGVDAPELHAWSASQHAAFWQHAIAALDIQFRTQPKAILETDGDVEHAHWMPGASYNIADSCFQADPASTAVVYQAEGGTIEKISASDLDKLSNRFANSLVNAELTKGDAIAIAMPMTLEAVVAYLGIVKAGCVVVSIADSFAADEIATRLRIGEAKAVLTQDVIHRAGKTLPMYQRVLDAGAPRCIVTSAGGLAMPLRDGDVSWDDFLGDNESFEAVPCAPDDATNILFSSGTTGDPKAIPWDHLTPIKSATDGLLHHDIHEGDVVGWPTNLGWMMGPWLIYAALLNRASIALYYGAPNTREFCAFVEKAGVTMLGVVPSLVKAWRAGDMLAGLDWTGVETFSSTGEASNAEDMHWLMAMAGYRPLIEYCGGTEIGGGYITSTVTRPSVAAAFSTPAFGLDVVILDEDGVETTNGELFLVPPSIGLSSRLLNRDHHEVYFEDTPTGPHGEKLRRHGDQKLRLPGDYYRALGRADDTMNLGGIKTSSAEIERVAVGVPEVNEAAAIAVSPQGGGPSQLVLFVTLTEGAAADVDALRSSLQKEISAHLNPLFRVHDVVVTDALPRTASNKVMRRVLRDTYSA